MAVRAGHSAEFYSKPCASQEVSCVDVLIGGEIKPGDDAKFAAFLHKNGEKTVTGGTVTLWSLGGDVVAGINIGLEVKAHHLNTYVPDKAACASMWGAIWLAGERRLYEPTARIATATRTVDSSSNAVMGAYYAELGLSYKAIAFLTAAPPKDMLWLNLALAKELGIEIENASASGTTPAGASRSDQRCGVEAA